MYYECPDAKLFVTDGFSNSDNFASFCYAYSVISCDVYISVQLDKTSNLYSYVCLSSTQSLEGHICICHGDL